MATVGEKQPVSAVPSMEADVLGVTDELDLAPKPKRITRDLPTPPGKRGAGKNRVTPEQFFEYLTKLTEEDWSHLIIYVYRLIPKINKRWKDKKAPVYSAKYGEAITEFTLLNDLGEGKYELVLNDLNIKTGGYYDSKVCTCFPTILDQTGEHPAKFDIHELDIGAQENKTLVEKLKFEGKLDSEGNIVDKDAAPKSEMQAVVGSLQQVINFLLNERKSDSSNRGPDKDALQKSLDMVSTAYKSVLDTAIKKDDRGAISELTELGKLLQTLMPPRNDNSDMFKQMLTMQADSHRQQLEMMNKMIELSRPKETDSEIKDVFKQVVQHAIGAMMEGGGRRGSGSTLDTILSHVPDILERVGPIAQSIIAVKLGGGQPVIQPNPQVPGGPQIQQTTTTPQVEGDQSMNHQNVIKQYGGIILTWLSQGKEGYDFADWVKGLPQGMMTYNSIRNIGVTNILTAMKGVPEFWNQVASIEPQVERFVTTFVRADEMVEVEDSSTGEVNVMLPEEVSKEAMENDKNPPPPSGILFTNQGNNTFAPEVVKNNVIESKKGRKK